MSRLGLLLALFCVSAGASPIAVSLLPREAVPTNSSHLKGYFQLQTSEYVSADQPYFGAGAQGESVALTLGLANDLNFATNATGRLVLSDQFSLSERWNYVNVNEAFATYQEGAAQLSVGRKLDTWIEWEETWQQGLVEPRYVQNRLRPETAGLSGLFYSARSENWGLTVGALPLNIPEFGPHFYVRDDKFVSANPWFHAPASEVRFQGVTSELHYAVAQPRTEDIVLKGGGIIKVEHRSGPASARFTYAYKPIAQMALGFPSDGLFHLPDHPQIVIHPRVVYDRLANLDLALERGPWRFSTSVAYDNPERDNGPDTWTSQVYSEAWIYSGLASVRLEDAGVRAARLETGVLKVAGGHARDHGRFSDEQSKFDPRFQYYEAYLLGLKREFRFGLIRPVAMQLRVVYDRMQNGGVFSYYAGYNLTKNWRADLDIDMLGLLGPSRAQISDAFLSNYRANDRIGLGVSYVF